MVDSKKKKEIDISSQIMKKIKKEEVKMKPHAFFVFGSVALGVGFVGVVSLTIFFLNLSLFRLGTHAPFGFILFGRFGLRPFLATFPWAYLTLSFIGLGLGAFLLKKYDISYKKSFLGLFFGLVILVLGLGFILDKTGFNQRVQRLKHLRPFYNTRFTDRDWVSGQIIKVDGNKINIITPREKEVTIVKDDKTLLPFGGDFLKGDRIKAVGDWEKEIFKAHGISKVRYLNEIGGKVKGINRKGYF